MSNWTRRSFMIATGAGGLAACTSQPSGVQEAPGRTIDHEIDIALSELYTTIPGTRELSQVAVGILVIPKVRKVGFFASGAYGEGALIIGPAKVDYYSLSQAAVGFTFGAAEFNQALFFMSQQALQNFRVSDGWTLGVGGQIIGGEDGASAGLSSNLINRPIQEVVFGQRGLIADASFAGAKYNRIVR